MTSRRKQVKPIKAHSDQLATCNNFVVPEVQVSEYQEELVSSGQSMAVNVMNFEEAAIKNVKSELFVNESIADFVDNKVLENADSILSLNELSEDTSKKLQKDEAKIIPFETSGGIDFFKCPLCNQSSICGRESLTCHLQEHQNKTKRDDGKHLCCLCFKELSSNSSLERHLLTHSNHRPFSCALCDKKFTTNGNLSRHIKTSHNNNGTIESSIDEVLKKHQMESSQAHSVEASTVKIKKHHKESKKGSLNMGLMGLKNCKMNMNFVSPSSSFEAQSKTEYNTYQSTTHNLNSNINLLSPFYSFNFNDLGFIRTNLNANSLSVMTTNINHDDRRFHNPVNPVKRTLLHSLQPRQILRNRRFRRKIAVTICHLRHQKKVVLSSNSIECTKCHKRILLASNVILHIRCCYKSHKNFHLFCPFKVCSKKILTLKGLLKHVKQAHQDIFYQSIEPVSPPLEPLNLSLKRSSSSFSLNLNGSTIESLTTRSQNYSNSISIHPNPSDIAIHFPTFPNINQFISNPTIVTLSPFQFPTPLTFSSSSLLGKTSSVPLIINDALDCSRPLLWNEKVPQSNSISSILKSEGSVCDQSSTSCSMSSKYKIGIKKKNSYKDAPKLITCPMDGCVQKFPWNSSLMRHILTHTAHKPFKCTRCIKSFSTKSNRERHMTRVHRVRINRSKFKSLQASRALMEDSSRQLEDGIDSENGGDVLSMQDPDMKIIELSEEEWIIMDDNDRRAEDISSNLLKLAGQPIVEPNPVRLHSIERKGDISVHENNVKNLSSLPNESFLPR